MTRPPCTAAAAAAALHHNERHHLDASTRRCMLRSSSVLRSFARMPPKRKTQSQGPSRAAKASKKAAANSQNDAEAPDIEDCGFGAEVSQARPRRCRRFLPPRSVLSAPTPAHPPPPPPLQIRSALLSWYDAHHRVLPWRRNPHSRLGAEALAAAAAEGQAPAPADLPTNQFIYYVWVCEIMCQQVP